MPYHKVNSSTFYYTESRLAALFCFLFDFLFLFLLCFLKFCRYFPNFLFPFWLIFILFLSNLLCFHLVILLFLICLWSVCPNLQTNYSLFGLKTLHRLKFVQNIILVHALHFWKQHQDIPYSDLTIGTCCYQYLLLINTSYADAFCSFFMSFELQMVYWVVDQPSIHESLFWASQHKSILIQHNILYLLLALNCCNLFCLLCLHNCYLVLTSEN